MFWIRLLSLIFSLNFAQANASCDKFIYASEYFHQTNPQKHLEFNPRSSDKPANKWNKFLSDLEQTHFNHKNNEAVQAKLYTYYETNYVIKKENIPDSYFDHQKKMARNQGHGDVVISEEVKNELSDLLINDQKFSFKRWLDYFFSEDSFHYSMDQKYWAFTGMLKLGNFTKEKGEFGKRTQSTVSAFAELNHEALATVMEEFKLGVESGVRNLNFGKLYGRELKRLEEIKLQLKDSSKQVDGEWEKYSKGSDPEKLSNDLQGKNTGWCTANIETAKTHLSQGDFYVYYSYDEMGDAVVPRLAIRMQGSEIAEVRGVGKDQNIDSAMASSDVLDKKLSEFGSKADKYVKRSEDMRRLTQLEEKQGEFSKEDLRFLYEIDEKIEGFGSQRDPRIDEEIKKRNIKSDLSEILGLREDEIGLVKSDLDSGKIKYFYGDFDLRSLQTAKGLVLPTTLNGNLYLASLQTAEGLVLPTTLNGDLDLHSFLQTAEGLVLPTTLNGNLYLGALQTAEGLVLPTTLNGFLDLRSLQTAEGLVLPTTLNGNLYLGGLNTAEGLVLPTTLNGNLHLGGLKTAKGLVLPTTLNGILHLGGLQTAEGLVLPTTLNGNLYLGGLKTAKGLVLPSTFNGNLYLGGLNTAEGLVLPTTLNGNLFLGGLQTTEGLVLPTTLNGNLYLGGLKTAKGLVLPSTFNGNLYLGGLNTAEGLVLPTTLNGNLFLGGLQTTEGLVLPTTLNGNLYLGGKDYTREELGL